MIGVYVHLAGEDVDEAILRMHGIKTNSNGKDLEVKQCPRCLMVNLATSRFCSRCGLPLTEEAIREVEEWEKSEREKNIRHGHNTARLAGKTSISSFISSFSWLQLMCR